MTGPSGLNGTGIAWIAKDSNYTASPNDGVNADLSNGSWTLTLPPNPNVGDVVAFADASGYFATNNLTVSGNGKNIMGLSEDLTCDINNMSSTLMFSGDYEGWVFWPYTDEGAGVSMPRDYVDGLILSNNVGAPNTTVDISPGECRSLADDSDLVFPSGMSKILNVVWAAGSGFGGLDAGAVAINTWYYVWAIKRSDNGTVDFLFSASSTDPVMPSPYDSKHCVGMIKTNGSGNIIPFDQHDDVYTWVTQVAEVNAAAGPGTETLLALTGVPSGFDVKALLRITATSATPGDDYYVRPTFQTSGYGAYVVCQVAGLINSTCETAVQAVSGRVNHKATSASVTVSLYVNGWIFNRGRNS